jgi:type IV pilus assembly protein PilE
MYKLQKRMPVKCPVKLKAKGFTLIELMIVVAIIAILAGIGYPSYQAQMRETRRSDAFTGLARIADLQERFYLQNKTYSTNMAELGGATSVQGYYTLSVPAADNNTYTLQAVATGTGPQAADTGCTTLTLNQAGTKTPANCWN